MSKKKLDPDDVRAGREYVEAYVSYIQHIRRQSQPLGTRSNPNVQSAPSTRADG
jgi:hypothetical protein